MKAGLFLSTGDHRSVGYRVPREWASVPEVQRGAASLGSFKRGSRAGFLAGYGAFRCGVAGCVACAGGWLGWAPARGAPAVWAFFDVSETYICGRQFYWLFGSTYYTSPLLLCCLL